jgi:hypothetical protein
MKESGRVGRFPCFYRALGSSEMCPSALPEQWPQHMASVAGGSEGTAATATVPLRASSESFWSWIGANPKLVRNRSKIRIIYLHLLSRLSNTPGQDRRLCAFANGNERVPCLRFDKEAAPGAG